MSRALTIPGPAGESVHVPWDPPADEPAGEDALRRHYRETGYVVARGLLSRADCARVRAAFDAEIRPHAGPLFRQTTGRPEAHELTPAGHVANPLIQVQDLQSRRFPEFKRAALDAITHASVAGAVASLLGEPAPL